MRAKQGLLSTLLTILIHDFQKQNPSMHTANEAMKHLPLVGYIPLGTGNGVGSVVGCLLSRGFRSILPGAKRRQPTPINKALSTIADFDTRFILLFQPTVKWLNYPAMLQVSFGDSQDELCFFAGVGFESLVFHVE
jgi:hypothetical protein